MDLKVEDVRMWDIFGGSELYANMEDQLDDELTAQSNALIDKQHVLLEERVRESPLCTSCLDAPSTPVDRHLC